MFVDVGHVGHAGHVRLCLCSVSLLATDQFCADERERRVATREISDSTQKSKLQSFKTKLKYEKFFVSFSILIFFYSQFYSIVLQVLVPSFLPSLHLILRSLRGLLAFDRPQSFVVFAI